MKIMVKKIKKKIKKKTGKQRMKNISPGHLVKADGGIYGITGEGNTGFLLNHSTPPEDVSWFAVAHEILNEQVEIVGKIKDITFEIE